MKAVNSFYNQTFYVKTKFYTVVIADNFFQETSNTIYPVFITTTILYCIKERVININNSKNLQQSLRCHQMTNDRSVKQDNIYHVAASLLCGISQRQTIIYRSRKGWHVDTLNIYIAYCIWKYLDIIYLQVIRLCVYVFMCVSTHIRTQKRHFQNIRSGLNIKF